MLMPPAVNPDDAHLLNLDWDQIGEHVSEDERYEHSEELEDHPISTNIEEVPEPQVF
jgi:hypothetical protein